jgi:ribose 1,5-bisphosphokinase
MSVMESKVFYLIGPSGAGKDSVIRCCRPLLTEVDRCFVAHRYITRPPELRGENHIWLSDHEFDKRRNLGAFAMHWEANGYRYGTGCEIDSWLDQGINVLVNGSRAYLPKALQAYHHRLVPILLHVEMESLRSRLIERGRESAVEIEERIQRARLQEDKLDRRMQRIDNNGSLESAARQLLQIIRRGSYLAGDDPGYWPDSLPGSSSG